MPHYDPEVELTRLFGRQVDHTGNTYSGFDTIDSVVRRANRSPGPSLGSSRNPSVSVAEPSNVRIAKLMQARRLAVAGRSRAPAQDLEIPESDAEPSDVETEEQESSEEIEEDEDVGLAPQDWNVVEVCGRRDEPLRGVDEYQIRWARTTHSTAEFRISTRRGRLRVKVGGRPWEIVSHVEAGPSRRTGEPQTAVEWAKTWHTIWELSSAFAAIVEFEVQNPRIFRQLATHKKPDLRDWPLYLQHSLDPEQGPEMDGAHHRIGQVEFDIEEGVDYTGSFLAHCKRELRHNRSLGSPMFAILLCLPFRQLLIFNDEFVRANGRFNAATLAKWKTIPVSMVGHARRKPCTYCNTTPPEKRPYRFCISWEGVFADACTNCVYAGSSSISSDCECRIRPITWKDGARLVQQPDVEFEAEDAESASSRDGSGRDAGDRSSIEQVSDEDGFSPPSQHSSPVRRDNEGEEGDSSRSEQRRSDAEPNEDHGASHQSTEGDVPLELRPRNHVDQSGVMGTGGPASSATRVVVDIPRPDGDHPSLTDGRARDEEADKSIPISSTTPTQSVSARQLSKRPISYTNDADTDQHGETQPKRTRRPMGEPEVPSPEDVENSSGQFKVEPTSSALNTSNEPQHGYDVSHHDHCAKNSIQACVDPDIGFPMKYNKLNPPEGVIYANENGWGKGDLDDKQVQFIMSRCPCFRIEYLRDGWERMVSANSANSRLSKYRVLSLWYTEELNHLIRYYCPGRPFDPEREEAIVIEDD